MTGSSEMAPAPLADSDGDGLPDKCETTVYGTDPTKADTDGNGVPDGKEDSDGDGVTNEQRQQGMDWTCPPPSDGGNVKPKDSGDEG